MICPCCTKDVPKSHFSCQSGAVGGKATGASKVRGTKAYYKRISKLAAEARARKKKEQEK